MMDSRERTTTALNHQEPDQVPLDLGGTAVTGMHVSSVYQLRQALELDEPGTPVKVVEPYQMLGEIGTDLMEALGVDVVPLKTCTQTCIYCQLGINSPPTLQRAEYVPVDDVLTELAERIAPNNCVDNPLLFFNIDTAVAYLLQGKPPSSG